MKSRRAMIAVMMALALALAPTLTGAGAAPRVTVGLSISTLNNPFFVDLRDGAHAAADKADLSLTILDAQNDPAKQASSIEDLIARKVKLVIINPTDSDAIVPTIKKLNAAGIPVITVDRGANGGVIVAHIASDNVAGGVMAAEYVGRRLNGKGSVVMLEGIAGTSAARDRGAGFRNGLKKYPGIKIIASQTADFDRAKGLQVMENILQAQKSIQAVFAQNDEMALGAIQAILAAKRDKEMVVVGFDAIADALKAVQAGKMAATIAQQPKVMGQLSVETAAAVLSGRTAPRFMPVPLKMVTR
jgi:ribose transport system substrate-binding protein